MQKRQRPDCQFSELNTQPTCTPVYASSNTSRCATQNSGPSGSLLLSRRTLSVPASCRFTPAHCIALLSPVESRALAINKHDPTYKDQSEGRRIGLACLVVSLVTGLQPLEAISINPFERKPNRSTEHGHEHREHEQHRIVSWSEHSEEVLDDESCAAKQQ